MNKEEIKSALTSILIGAIPIFLVSLLEGLLDFIRNNAAELIGASVASWKYALHAKV